MIECHPLLKPILAATRPVVHAVRHIHRIGPRHHIHHIVHAGPSAPATTMTVMTVCKKIGGPLLAGGVALLPPGSGLPPAGGIGGFPGGVPGDFVAPGPAAYGPGLFPANIAGPGIGTGIPAAPVLFAGAPGGVVPAVVGPGVGSPGVSPGDSTPSTPTTTTTTTPPSGGGTQPNGPSPPGNGGGGGPGDLTPVPEPASALMLAAGIGVMAALRHRLRRRNA